MEITFSGGVRTVSGSLSVIEAAGHIWFVDCGLFQGGRRDMYARNAYLPVAADEVSGVFLTHAHVDHSGRLPRLVKQGFRGKIFATQATIDLCKLLLFDSAFVIQSQTASLNKKREQRGLPALPDLYTEADVVETIKQMIPVNWNQIIEPVTGLKVKYLTAGHILGASTIVIREELNNKETTVVFSGDLGRKNEWVLPNPELPKESDIIVIESTYGDRIHRPYSYAKSELRDNINETIELGGKIIIPAFSVGRTQRMLFEINTFIEEGAIPEVPVYLDSPLSINASKLFLKYSEKKSIELTEIIEKKKLKCKNIVSAEESRKLIEKPGPYIVITASGMCEAGRVLYHLKKNLPEASSRVIFCGFCAENTLGRLLIDNNKCVKILGDYINVNAKIDYVDTLSSHADQNELIEWVRKQPTASSVFITHGEEQQSFSLAEKIESECKREVIIPLSGEKFNICEKDIT